MTRASARERIFVGQGFVARPGLTKAYEHLEGLLQRYPDMIAMLEFTSRGGNRRQIDCALIGPGGVDLIEIKNKHGVVLGTPEGEWTVTRDGVTEGFSNLKNGYEENPVSQARNSADDFKTWLTRTTGAKVWVSPMVWLPSADPASVIERDSFVWHAVGLAGVERQLRSSTKLRNAWGGAQYRDLPRLHGLKPIDHAYVMGQVVDGKDLEGIPGLRVIIKVMGETRQTVTGDHGQFDFVVRKDEEIEVAFGVPDRYDPPPIFTSTATLDYARLDKVVLQHKPPQQSVEELQENHRAAQEELRRHVEEKLRRSGEAWRDEHFRMALVIDELRGQLRDTLMQLREQQSLLSQQAAEAAQRSPVGLPAQIQQATLALELQRHREQVQEALTQLSDIEGADQADLVRRGTYALASARAVGRRELIWSKPAVVAVRPLKESAREPTEWGLPSPEEIAPAAERPRDLPEPLESGTSPSATRPLSKRVTAAPIAPPGRAGLTWGRVFGLIVLVLGSAFVWQMTRSDGAAAPLKESAGASTTLPGVDASRPPAAGALPGVPAPRDR